MRRGDAGPKFAEKALQYFQMLHPNTERIDVFFDQLLEKVIDDVIAMMMMIDVTPDDVRSHIG